MKRTGAILDLPIHPYGMWLHLYAEKARYRSAVNAACKKKSEHITSAYLADAQGLCTHFGVAVYVGVFNSDPGTLAHELAHTMEHIIERVSLPRGFDSEPIAYLYGYLFRQCHEALGKHVRRKS